MRGPAVLTVARLAEVLDTSSRTIYRLDSDGEIPRPSRLRGQSRWLKSEIDAWLEAGMPSRKTWESMRGARFISALDGGLHR